MASFQAKIGRKRPRREKIKIIVPFRSVPTLCVIGNSKKNIRKIRKTKQYHYGFISSENRLEKAEKQKNYKLSFRSVPTQNVIEISKKIAKKIEKTKQYHYGFISSKNKLEKAEKEKNVNYRSVPFLHDT